MPGASEDAPGELYHCSPASQDLIDAISLNPETLRPLRPGAAKESESAVALCSALGGEHHHQGDRSENDDTQEAATATQSICKKPVCCLLAASRFAILF